MRIMRIAIPLLALLLGLVVAWAVHQTHAPTPQDTPRDAPPVAEVVESPADTTPAADPAPDRPAAPPQPQEPTPPVPVEPERTPGRESDAEPHTPQMQPATPTAPVDEPVIEQDEQPQAAAIAGLRPRVVDDRTRRAIGSIDPASGFKLQVDTTAIAASIYNVWLTDFRQHVDPASANYVLMQENRGIYPLAFTAVMINGEQVSLASPDGRLLAIWQASDVEADPQSQSITYTAEIVNGDDQPVLRINRTYTVVRGSYELYLSQELVNLTDKPLEVVFVQHLQGDVTPDGAAYMGDRRQFVVGYFYDAYDRHRNQIWTKNGFVTRHQVVDQFIKRGQSIWPRDRIQGDLAWLASENRYFAAVIHAPADHATRAGDVPSLESIFEQFDVVLFPTHQQAPALKPDERVLMITGTTPTITVTPGPNGSSNVDLAIFAGPRKREVFSQHPYTILQFDDLIRYNLGGPCAFCTFQWLAKLLLGFMHFIHNILGDWGLAIIILVLVVRLLLHPITKKAQVNMMKMGKQMQSLQPEIEQLKKKYTDDQQKLNQEMMKLYREKGINPFNMLGCLPMFLQMPIWIALYAMLYFAIELRHEPAFYGVFQAISGGRWEFLGDLSRSDRFITFFADNQEHTISLWLIQFDYTAFNILPILMAVVFFFQQKLTMPPPANEQAAQQQKIMRIMILFFPVLLYSAPSGLTLYILASTAAGIVDSWIVRRTVRKQEEAGTLFQKKQPKPGGLMDRIHKAVEQKQREMQQFQEKQSGKPQGKGKKRK